VIGRSFSGRRPRAAGVEDRRLPGATLSAGINGSACADGMTRVSTLVKVAVDGRHAVMRHGVPLETDL